MVNIIWIIIFAIVLGAAWFQRPRMTGGPRTLLTASLAALGVALGMLIVSLMLEVPDSRGLFIALALAAVGVLAVRSMRGGGGRLHAQTAGYTVRTVPRRVSPATRAPSPLRPGYVSPSRTVRDIENAEVE